MTVAVSDQYGLGFVIVAGEGAVVEEWGTSRISTYRRVVIVMSVRLGAIVVVTSG